MQIGFVGLGRMGGGNMVERLRRGGNDGIGYDRNPSVSDVGSLSELASKLAAPLAADQIIARPVLGGLHQITDHVPCEAMT